jgi:uncharacterized membrane protein
VVEAAVPNKRVIHQIAVAVSKAAVLEEDELDLPIVQADQVRTADMAVLDHTAALVLAILVALVLVVVLAETGVQAVLMAVVALVVLGAAVVQPAVLQLMLLGQEMDQDMGALANVNL